MTQAAENRPSPAHAFIGIVRGWDKDQKGRLAALRRNAGEPLKDARGVTWMYDILTDFERGYGDETLFLTATLLALDRPYLKNGRTFTGSLGRTMSILKNVPGANAESLERRLAILLDADFDPKTGEGELPFRLRQTVKLIVSKEGSIDWAKLLNDLRRWNDPGKAVQKQWAKDFYTAYTETQFKTETQGETNAD